MLMPAARSSADATGHVEAIVVKRGGPGDARERIVIDFYFPDELSVGSVNFVQIRFDVAEVRGEFSGALQRRNIDGVAHAGIGLEGPVDAAARGVDGIHRAGIDANENAPAATVGCPYTSSAPGKPKAHFSFSCGI